MKTTLLSFFIMKLRIVAKLYKGMMGNGAGGSENKLVQYARVAFCTHSRGISIRVPFKDF